MFITPIYGEINGKPIKIILGKRYKITTKDNVFEGTIRGYEKDCFFVSTVNYGIYIDFENINDIEEIL